MFLCECIARNMNSVNLASNIFLLCSIYGVHELKVYGETFVCPQVSLHMLAFWLVVV
jgi:hypothetical protein